MWRDRTNLFISYRQSYSHYPAKKPRYHGPSSNGFAAPSSSLDEERRGLMADDPSRSSPNGDAVIEMSLLPPRWLDIRDDVLAALSTIAAQTKRLASLHQKHVLPGFDDEAVKRREEAEIEALTAAVTRGFVECQGKIRKIERMVREAKSREGGGGLARGEEVMARNLMMALAARVGEASAAFRRGQAAYLKKLRALASLSPTPLSRSSTPTQNPYTDPSLTSTTTAVDADLSLSHSTLFQTAQKKRAPANANDALISQREREINDIANSIIALAHIFQEIQAMVIDQGSLLDRIDYNVERVAGDVKEAERELTVAAGYQKRGVKRKIILLLLILIAGAGILLGLKVGRRRGGGSGGGGAGASALQAAPLEGLPAMRMEVGDMAGNGGLRMRRKDWRRRKRRLWEGGGEGTVFVRS